MLKICHTTTIEEFRLRVGDSFGNFLPQDFRICVRHPMSHDLYGVDSISQLNSEKMNSSYKLLGMILRTRI